MNDADRLTPVFTTDDSSEADILAVALRNEGIPCEIEGERQGGLAGLSVSPIKLLVRVGDIDRAHDYLERTRRHKEGGESGEDFLG